MELDHIINTITCAFRSGGCGAVICIKMNDGKPYAFGPFTDETSAFEFVTRNGEIDETITVQTWFING